MDKYCIICNETGKYKCPTCLIYYCSAQCCQKHRENQCDVISKPQTNFSTSENQISSKFLSADAVPLEKLMLLRGNDTLNNLLCNPHLRNLLIAVNNSSNPEEIMQKAMQEPLFLEFADVCLKIVEPISDQDKK